MKGALKGSFLLAEQYLYQGQSISGANPEKGFLPKPFYCTTKRLAADVYIFPSRLKGLAALKIREILIINPTAFALLLRVSLSLPALNPGDFISSLLIHVFCGICFSDYDTFACTPIEAAQLM